MNSDHSGFETGRRSTWRELASTTNGHPVEGSTLGPRDRVLIPHRQWTIVLDTEFSAATKSDWTRIRTAYTALDDLRFSIHRRGLLSDVASILGAQDVSVGHEPFDHDFVIKGNDAARLRDLLSSARLRDLLSAQERTRLSVREPSEPHRVQTPARAAEVRIDAPGGIVDVNRLRGLVDLAAAALDELRRVGAAGDAAPTPALCVQCGHELVDQPVCPECGTRAMA